MSSFSASELFNVSAHIAILRRGATEMVSLATDAIEDRQAEGVGVYSFLTAVALVITLVMGIAAYTAPLPWGLAALSIRWEQNDDLLFAIGSDPSEVRISSIAEQNQLGSSLLSKKIALKTNSLEGTVVADWFESVGATDAAETVRSEIAQAGKERIVDAVLGGILLLLAPFLTAMIALRVTEPPANMGAADLAAPLALWEGFWGLIPLPFSAATLLLPYSGAVASISTMVTLLVIAGAAWQLHKILESITDCDLKQSLIVYFGSALILWGAGVGLSLGISSLV